MAEFDRSVKLSHPKSTKAALEKGVTSGKQPAKNSTKPMEFPEHIALIVAILAVFAGCLIALASIAIGAVHAERGKNIPGGERLRLTASPTTGGHGAA